MTQNAKSFRGAYIEDAVSNTTVFNYDNESRITNILYADSSSINRQYDLLGRLTNQFDGAGVSVTNWFNNQGLLIAVSNSFGQVETISYDVLDRPTSIVNANGVSVSMTYDSLNRLLTRSYSGGGTESFGYSAAGLVAYTNQDMKPTHYGYDNAGRKVTETNANNQVILYGYDGANDLISLTDGLTHTTSWGYDLFGRVIGKTNTLGATMVTYSYDADGRITSRVMMGTNTSYTYDAVGNLKTIVYPQLTITNFYDAVNELTNMNDGVGTTQFTYTGAGQLASETSPWSSDTLSFTYNQGHRASLSLTQPSGSSWAQTYTYDPAWRMFSIGSPAGNFGYGYGSTAQECLAQINLPNGAFITNTYDN